MSRWRILILLSIMGSLFLIVASTMFGWEPWSSLSFLRDGSFGPPPFVHRLAFDRLEPTLAAALVSLFTMYLFGVLALFAFPRQVACMERSLPEALPGLLRASLLGLLMALVITAIAVSASLTAATFMLTILLVGALFVSALLGYLALSYGLGRRLLARAGWQHLSPLYGLMLGLLITFALAELPFLGAIFKALFASLGTGLVVLTRFGSGKPWSLQPLLEE